VRSLRVDCIPQISEALSQDLAGKTVIVIDALRATSNIVTALSNGAVSVWPVETVAQAKQAAGANDLLAGERQCKKIPGFDLGNSPLEFTEQTVSGQRIVMTTTNGTRGIQKAAKAAAVLAGSMLNARACAETALQWKRDIVLLCAGTKDVFALEDGLCAGLIAKEIRELRVGDLQFSDFTRAMEGAYDSFADRLEDVFSTSDSGIRLGRLGYGGDVSFCAQRNTTDTVPILTNGEMRAFSPRQIFSYK